MSRNKYRIKKLICRSKKMKEWPATCSREHNNPPPMLQKHEKKFHQFTFIFTHQFYYGCESNNKNLNYILLLDIFFTGEYSIPESLNISKQFLTTDNFFNKVFVLILCNQWISQSEGTWEKRLKFLQRVYHDTLEIF